MAQISLIPSGITSSHEVGFGTEAKTVGLQLNKAINNWTFPTITRQPDLQKFCNLAVTWMEETKVLSTVREIALNPSYQEIIGMGRVALPFILYQLAEQPDHWFWALKFITGVDPVKKTNRGRIDLMANDWLEWGKKNGTI